MPPTRTRDPAIAGEGSVSADAESKSNEDASPKHWRRKKDPIPGVSKLKAAIRQTRRLLAKDKLAADVRVETERRLKSLETDLANAQVAKKERNLAVRYHRVKFFGAFYRIYVVDLAELRQDRQKLTRKIKQTKKQLAADDLSRKARKSLESILFELRVDVHYVLNYPKTEKYISLFPPEVRHTPGAYPVHSVTSEEKTITDARREELRDWIRPKMQAGEMSAEPETLHADGESRSSKKEANELNGKGKAKKGGEKGKEAMEDADEDEDEDEEEDDSGGSEGEDVDMQNVEDDSESEPEPEPVQVKAKSKTKLDPASGQAKSKITKPSKEPLKTEKVAKPEKKAPKPEKKIARPEKKVAKSERQAAKPEKKVSTIEADDFFGSDSN
ncbi:hypothetical protein EWM64_g6688 [Hericium alpestre]|uniref:rRNA-processing protein EFG1 n=1 Tax=Hericium alpestre TaxID=135208 RepID=A0A4Y9ZTG8_9AGAM|nr:hypothetical protein EWM64_g6688 [Hericium alpestre]